MSQPKPKSSGQGDQNAKCQASVSVAAVYLSALEEAYGRLCSDPAIVMLDQSQDPFVAFLLPVPRYLDAVHRQVILRNHDEATLD